MCNHKELSHQSHYFLAMPCSAAIKPVPFLHCVLFVNVYFTLFISQSCLKVILKKKRLEIYELIVLKIL